MRRTALLAGALLAGASSQATAEPRPFVVAAPPAWIESAAAGPVTGSDAEASEGVRYLLLDHQVRLQRGGVEHFRRFAKEVVNAAGLETSSQVKVELDPTYQRAVFHFVRVHRAGRVLDRLDPSRIKVLQREPDLEAQVYDGALSLVQFVEDLRVGDVLEYAYTVAGTNPVFEGRYQSSFATEWTAPVHRARVRLVFPAERALAVRTHASSTEPLARASGAARELVWETLDPPAVPGDRDAPQDWGGWGWIQVSEWSRWSEVAEWGARLFAAADAPPAELAPRLAAWRALGRPAAVHAALRFVQDEVRYLGIELGPSAHRPHPPAEVAQRRFGDCKDKALLFCSLARALGARCWPALVNTSAGETLDDWLPSPVAFDHAVALVEVDGRSYWADPTLSAQGGGPGASEFPDYRRALILRPGEQGLTVIPAARPREPDRVVRERFLARDPAKPAMLEVETRLLGAEADAMRADLRRRSREEIARSWLEYYARSYPQVRAEGALGVEDDREQNRLVTLERYVIPGFWSKIEGEASRSEAFVSATTIAAELRKPPPVARLAPLALHYPCFVRHVTEVALPRGSTPATGAYRWSGPELRFDYRSRFEDGTLIAEYELETHRDRVPLERVASHAENVDALRSYLDWDFEYPPRGGPRPRGPNWPVLAVAALVGLLGLLLALLAFRRLPRVARPRWPAAAALVSGLLGLGALLVYGLVRGREGLSAAGWDARTSPGRAQYSAAWAPLLLAGLAGRLLLLVGCLLALALFLAGRRSTATASVTLLAGTALLFAEAMSLALVAGGTAGATHAGGAEALASLAPLFLTLPALWLTRPAGR